MAHDEFDVIVIGAGPAGENVASRVVRGGLTAAVVENRLAGGECSYWACIPSKTLLRPLALAAEVSRVPGMRLAAVDVDAVLRRRNEAISELDDTGQVGWIEGLPARFIRGWGRLTSSRSVAVRRPDGQELTLSARHAIVLATGSTPIIPDIPGLAAARPWTNREITGADVIPERLIIVGGGAVACEMAQAMRGHGARQVTVLARGSLLRRAEPFAGELLAETMLDAGIDVRLNAQVARVDRPEPGGEVTVHLADASCVEANEILVAAGRKAASAGLGLEAVGLTPGSWLNVDDSLRAVDCPGGCLYAVGDLNGRSLLTHMGKYQARVCGDVLVARARGTDDTALSLRDHAHAYGAPYVLFTDPQVCSVGLTEAGARARGLRLRAVEYDLAGLAGTYVLGDNVRGRAKIVVDEDRRVVVGATFVGPGTAELLHAATVAVTSGITLDQLWHAVPAFPTVSEVWLRMLEAYGL
ncbi:NAD(P)/FAD-dependent oxidoreductase [Kribbella shirazensis]|uniref:Dihydrolipoamide dehydrogenase n=1 Tax=Kribbella shirazensis TaxID=1105143 RepID=A0A7X5VHL4_9ACTN|nr:dihydrolipoamide dehydrogenase [Kribbella shirazensis]